MAYKVATPSEQIRQFAFGHNDQKIYFCLRWCGRISLGFIYATDPRGIHSEEGDPRFTFDVRDQAGGESLDKIHADFGDHRKIIATAIDSGNIRSIADVHNIKA